jgi:hypothetical protein
LASWRRFPGEINEVIPAVSTFSTLQYPASASTVSTEVVKISV